MLKWAIIFLGIAILSALFGYRNMAASSSTIAKILFFLFLVISFMLFMINLFSPNPMPVLVS